MIYGDLLTILKHYWQLAIVPNVVLYAWSQTNINQLLCHIINEKIIMTPGPDYMPTFVTFILRHYKT